MRLAAARSTDFDSAPAAILASWSFDLRFDMRRLFAELRPYPVKTLHIARLPVWQPSDRPAAVLTPLAQSQIGRRTVDARHCGRDRQRPAASVNRYFTIAYANARSKSRRSQQRAQPLLT